MNLEICYGLKAARVWTLLNVWVSLSNLTHMAGKAVLEKVVLGPIWRLFSAETYEHTCRNLSFFYGREPKSIPLRQAQPGSSALVSQGRQNEERSAGFLCPPTLPERSGLVSVTCGERKLSMRQCRREAC